MANPEHPSISSRGSSGPAPQASYNCPERAVSGRRVLRMWINTRRSTSPAERPGCWRIVSAARRTRPSVHWGCNPKICGSDRAARPTPPQSLRTTRISAGTVCCSPARSDGIRKDSAGSGSTPRPKAAGARASATLAHRACIGCRHSWEPRQSSWSRERKSATDLSAWVSSQRVDPAAPTRGSRHGLRT